MRGVVGRHPALVLFDIDGTLIRRAGPHHREVLEDALWRVLRVRASTATVPVQGMLDPDILTEMMRQNGVPVRRIREAMPELIERAQSLYVRRCPDLRAKVCPGVRPLLRKLTRMDVPMGLVTGNLSRIGWKKMERAGLKVHFRFGAFAEAATTRARLAGLAMAKARQAGWIGETARVSLVGDHPNDILAARANGIFSVAVATGLAPFEELAAHKPDVLVEDLRRLPWECLLPQ
jgi:phosphoglycolate phosphatase